MTSLHPQLLEDCHLLGNADTGVLLLHRNALVPWLILVPAVHATELHELESSLYHQILSEVRRLAEFIKSRYGCDKVNIATIGNVVPQLHIHVTGRSRNDPCWPKPIWGHLQDKAMYSEQHIRELRTQLLEQYILHKQPAA